MGGEGREQMDRHVAALLPYNPRLSLRRRVTDCGNPREGRDQMDRHVASLLPYNPRLSLRRRVADCGNPREGRDQMDRHVAALLAMTGGGGKVHGHDYPTARRWSELSR